MAIVDDQDRERGLAGPAAKLAKQLRCRRPCLADGALGCVVRCWSRVIFWWGCCCLGECEAASVIGRDQTLPPRAAAKDELPDRQGIDEFVGEHDKRSVRQRVELSMPAQRHWRSLEGVPLCLNRDIACLDERHGDAIEEFRNAPPGTDRILHQSAAP